MPERFPMLDLLNQGRNGAPDDPIETSLNITFTFSGNTRLAQPSPPSRISPTRGDTPFFLQIEPHLFRGCSSMDRSARRDRRCRTSCFVSLLLPRSTSFRRWREQKLTTRAESTVCTQRSFESPTSSKEREK